MRRLLRDIRKAPEPLGLGRARIGQPRCSRAEERFLSPKRLDGTQGFFDRHRTKALVLSRFVPLVTVGADESRRSWVEGKPAGGAGGYGESRG